MCNNKQDEDTPDYEKKAKVFVASLLSLGIPAYIMIKLWNTQISIPNFDYLYFLSTVMAIFAIVLSILFYFKSTEHSNEFYNNVFSFIKETSTILAELKTNIGHIEQGVYKSLFPDTSNAKEELEIIRNKEQTLKEQLKQSIEKNAKDRAAMQQLQEYVEKTSMELAKLEKEKQSLKEDNKEIIEPRLFDYLYTRFRLQDEERRRMYLERPSRLKIRLNRFFEDTFNTELIRDAKKIGLIDEDKNVMHEKFNTFIQYIQDR